MADLNMNTKLQGVNAVNGFVRENLAKPLQNNQEKDKSEKTPEKSNERQKIADEFAKNLSDLSREELDDTISKLNDSLQNIQRNLEFSLEKDVGRIVINVRDKETDEVLRQIPTEEMLELARNLQEVNEKLNERTDSNSQAKAEGVFFKTSV